MQQIGDEIVLDISLIRVFVDRNDEPIARLVVNRVHDSSKCNSNGSCVSRVCRENISDCDESRINVNGAV